MKIRRVEKMPVQLKDIEVGALFRCIDDKRKTILMKVGLYSASPYVIVDKPNEVCFVLNFETGSILAMGTDRMVVSIPTDNIELVWSDSFSEE